MAPLRTIACLLLAVAAPHPGAIGQQPNEGERDLAPIPGVPSLRGPVDRPKAKAREQDPAGALARAAGVAKTAPERVRPEFQPGLTYRFVVRTEIQTLAPAGSPGGFTLEQQARLDAKVRTDGKAGVLLKARTERLDLTLAAEGRSLSYESLKPADQASPLGRHLRASLNRSVDLALDPKGGVEGALEGGSGDEAALLPGVPRLGPEELAALVASLGQGFPERSVGQDDTWTLRGARSFEGVGALSFDLAYRHLGPALFEGHNCVAIDYQGALAGRLPGEDGGHGREGASPDLGPELRTNGLRGRLHYDPLERMVRHLDQSIDLWLGEFPKEDEEGATATRPAPVPFRERTTVRLLHIVPTP
jgi:hypothetical protein